MPFLLDENLPTTRLILTIVSLLQFWW